MDRVLAAVKIVNGIPCEQMICQAEQMDEQSCAECYAKSKTPIFFCFLCEQMKETFRIHRASFFDASALSGSRLLRIITYCSYKYYFMKTKHIFLRFRLLIRPCTIGEIVQNI